MRFLSCRFLFAAVFAAAVFVGAACSRRTSAVVPLDSPCILLVTMELLRADRIGVYGGSGTFTPVLDGLAAAGARFDDLQAVAPLSLPTLASVLTGRYPPEHGLRIPAGQNLGADVLALSGALRTAGYRAAAFVADPDLGASGLDQAFGSFVLPEKASPPKGVTATNLRPRAFEKAPHEGLRRGETVTTAALAWLSATYASSSGASPSSSGPSVAVAPRAFPSKGQAKIPFFLWVHFADVHFRDSPEQTRFRGGEGVESYDAEVAYMDFQLGRLLAFLEETGLRDRTIILVAGVHGVPLGPEAVDDPGLLLSDETLQVPGIVCWPGRIAAGTRIGATLDQTTLAPTILALSGLGDFFPEPIAERSVAAFLLGKEPDVLRPRSYAETLWPQHAYGLPVLRGWTDANFRFIAGSAPPQPRKEAPSPGTELSAKEGAEALALLEAGFPAETIVPSPLPDAAFDLPEGWDRLEFVLLWQRVARRMRNPSTSDETLLDDCRLLAEARPAYAPFHTWQGISHSLLRQGSAAVAAHRRALDVSPERTPHLLSNLGLAHLEQGELVRAIDLLEDAYLARTDDAMHRDNLAAVLMNTGMALVRNEAFNDAMACMTRVLYLQPENAIAHVSLGGIYQRMGRADLASASYRRALELRPGFKPAQLALKNLELKDSP